MSTFKNRISVVATLAVGIALSASWSVPAFSQSASSEMQGQTGASFHPGERVRMRSGGPMMTVDSIKGNEIDCYWTNWDGVPISERFPSAILQKF